MVNNRLAKIGFYLLSMFFFIVIVCILSWDVPISLEEGSRFVGWGALFTTKGILIPVICLLLFLYIIVFLFWLFHFTKSTRIGPIYLKEIKDENSEVMSFIASYFFPLVSFNVGNSWRHAIVLLGLFILIGIIYVTSNIYYCNPTLSVLGFHVYSVVGYNNSKKLFSKKVITFGKLTQTDSFKYISIDENTCFAYKL